MSDANHERALLQRLADGPVSGDVLAREAGLTRAAVWKRIAALRDAGIAISASPGRGYRLERSLDLLDAGGTLIASDTFRTLPICAPPPGDAGTSVMAVAPASGAAAWTAAALMTSAGSR